MVLVDGNAREGVTEGLNEGRKVGFVEGTLVAKTLGVQRRGCP